MDIAEAAERGEDWDPDEFDEDWDPDEDDALPEQMIDPDEV